MKKIIRFFDRAEDKVRAALSRYPIIYAVVGGIGVVLFWRGIWHTADLFPFLSGPVSAIVGLVLLLMSGLFVSVFIGNRIIVSGLKGEKKIYEKTEAEIIAESGELGKMHKEIHQIQKGLDDLKHKKETHPDAN